MTHVDRGHLDGPGRPPQSCADLINAWPWCRTIRGRRDLYGGRLVLTNTVFGIEAPRPLRPLHRLVGPLEEEEEEEGAKQAGLQGIKPGGKDVAAWLDGLAKSGHPPQVRRPQALDVQDKASAVCILLE